MSQDRRNFLKRTGAVVSAVAVGACAPRAGESTSPSPAALDAEILAAVGEVVLPAELEAEGRATAVRDFLRWADAYETVPELDHGYGTAEIRYGPADPKPGWQAQLQALTVEAGKRHGAAFGELDLAARETLLRRHIQDEGPGMPPPLAARHVGVALLSHWLRSPDATDRAYEVRITPLTCRGVPGVSQMPEDRT
jgi:hypothetical protein